MSFIYRYYSRIFDLFDFIFSPFLFLAIRLWIASIFWNSGMTKFNDWQGTVALFTDVYKVSCIDPNLAAYLTTAIELSCPILLVMGLTTRLATIPMLVLVAMMETTFLSSIDHFYWAVLLSALLCKGSGLFSVDYFLTKKYSK